MLRLLDAESPDYFHRMMRGCRSLSNSTPEIDGLHAVFTNREQSMFDRAIEREERLERQGYVTPAQACAFLASARRVRLDVSIPPPLNPVVEAYFRGLEREWTPPIEQTAPDAFSSVE